MPRSNRLWCHGWSGDWFGGKSSTRIATFFIRLRNSSGNESNASSATLMKSSRFIVQPLSEEVCSSRLFGTCSGYAHWVNLKFVQPCCHRWITFAETSSLGFTFHFQNREPEGSTSCQYRTVEKKPACVEVLLKIAPVLVDQAPLLVRHVVWKRGARRDQLEEVVLFGHGNVKF